MAIVPDLQFPEFDKHKQKYLLGGRYFAGKYRSFARHIILSFLWIFVIGFLFWLVLLTSEDDKVLLFMVVGSLSSTAFFASIVLFYLSPRDKTLNETILLNESAIEPLQDNVQVSSSVIYSIAKDWYNDFPENGITGKTVDQRTFTIGRLTNAGPYRDYGCVTIELENVFDHVIIDAHKGNDAKDLFNFRQRLGGKYRLELEGDFYKQFNVYTPNTDTARVLMYVFTPDIMAQVMDTVPAVDIEIVDKTMIIAWREPSIHKSYVDWVPFIEHATAVANTLGQSIEKRIKQYQKSNTAKNEKHMTATVRGYLAQLIHRLRVLVGNILLNEYMAILVFLGLSMLIFATIAVLLGLET